MQRPNAKREANRFIHRAELILPGRNKDGEKVKISAGKHGLAFNGEAVAAAA